MTTPGIFLTVFGRSAVGKERVIDEDAFLIADLTGDPTLPAVASSYTLQVNQRGVLLAVSDGMGGAQAGEVASALVLSALRQAMSSVEASSAEVAMRSSIEAANQQVFHAAQASGRVGMGATLTAVLFHDSYAYIAEIGDSRAYLVRGTRIAQLTHDQSYVQQLLDMGAITPDQAEVFPLRNIITQAMGLGPKIDVALRRISTRAHDRFLVCSDGLSGSLEDEDLLGAMVGDAALDGVGANLMDLAVARGSEDDITVILAEVRGEGARAMTALERTASVSTAPFDPATITGDLGPAPASPGAAAQAMTPAQETAPK